MDDSVIPVKKGFVLLLPTLAPGRNVVAVSLLES